MEQILLEAITSQMKHITGKSQQRFTKCKLCLTKSVTFYNKVTYFVDVEQVVDTVYQDFFKAFHSLRVPHLEKALCYSLGQWSVW